MTLSEKLLYLLGVVLIIFGFIFLVGGIGNMVDPKNEGRMLEWIFWIAMFGAVPLVGGTILCGRMRRQGRLRKQELRERNVLQLAKDNQGNLTVADVAREMSVSSTEAKTMLDQCHSNGLADISVSESGAVIYSFKTG